MKNTKIVKASALLIGCLITLSTVAFADGTNTVNATTSASIQTKPPVEGRAMPGKFGGFGHKGDMRDNGMFKPDKGPADLSTVLKDFVSDGTITQATLDKITAYQKEEQAARQAEMDKLKAMTPAQRKAYFEANKPNKENAAQKKSPFDGMVQKGILTQQQVDTIMQKLHDKQEAQEQANLKTQLDTLVANKTITQDQADKVSAYMQKLESDRAAEMQKIQAMTQEERDAYFKGHIDQKQSPLAQLVTDGTLTQNQLNAVEKVLHPGKPGHMGRPHGDKDKQPKGFLPKL